MWTVEFLFSKILSEVAVCFMKLLEWSKPDVSAKEDCTGTLKCPTISYLVAKDRINNKLRAWNCKGLSACILNIIAGL